MFKNENKMAPKNISTAGNFTKIKLDMLEKGHLSGYLIIFLLNSNYKGRDFSVVRKFLYLVK